MFHFFMCLSYFTSLWNLLSRKGGAEGEAPARMGPNELVGAGASAGAALGVKTLLHTSPSEVLSMTTAMAR
jgi:hypothetical protein